MTGIMEYIIKEILKQLMACGSVTNTEREKKAEIWMQDFFSKLPFFQKYPELCGLFPIPGDPLGRTVVWALVTNDQTITERDEAKAANNPVVGDVSNASNTAVTDETAKTSNAPHKPTVILMGHHDVVVYREEVWNTLNAPPAMNRSRMLEEAPEP